MDEYIFESGEIQDKLSHAYLIVGKTNTDLEKDAIELAKKILCEKEYKKNCIECNTCKKINNGNHTELKIISNNEKNIKIEEIKELKYNFQKKGMTKGRRVYIINGGEKLTHEAANAMLKFIEEPSEKTYAIITTKNIEKVLETIKSRCRIIYINHKNEGQELDKYKEDIKEILIKIEKDKLNSIYSNKEIIYDLDKELQEKILDNIEEIYLDYLHKKIRNYNDVNDYILKNNSKEKLIKKIKITNKYQERVKTNANISLILDAFLIEISEA